MTNTTQENAGKSPTHIVYQVRDGRMDKSYWTRIGAGWPHGDGKGLSIQLDCLPLDGWITVRESEK